jgi:hypothetical protein
MPVLLAVCIALGLCSCAHRIAPDRTMFVQHDPISAMTDPAPLWRNCADPLAPFQAQCFHDGHHPRSRYWRT